MFKSFFPNPKLFFWSALGWTIFTVLLWFFAAKEWGQYIGLPNPAEGTPPIIGVSTFWSKPFLWFYIYFAAITAIFSAAWWKLSPNKWYFWSVLGTALIIFTTYFQVQVSVAINAWYGPFYDLLEVALDKSGRKVEQSEIFDQLSVFFFIALVSIIVFVLSRFFVSHYVFRWRTAMNNYYSEHWQKLRAVEGASQRVQEDTMRFANIMQGLGKSMIDSVMTLIAFLPVLHQLEDKVKEVYIIGSIPYPLITLAILWSLFGTFALATLGFRLPGIEFDNQKVEAALRKELVFGEEDANRASPATLRELFKNVKTNYHRMFANYTYFNAGINAYNLADVVFPILMLIPTIVSKTITLGDFTRINNSFGQVRDSFQFLVNSWPTIVELISIFKRLRLFESAIEGGDIKAIQEPA